MNAPGRHVVPALPDRSIESVNPRSLIPWLWLAAVCLPSVAAAGPVYRYVDPDGVVHYTDKPPTPDARPIELKPVQTVGSRPAPGETATSPPGVTPPTAAASPAAARIEVGIASPTADETLRGDDRRLPVSLILGSPIPDGAGLLYLLDGRAQNAAPTRALSFTMENVERGSHLIGARLVDSTGQELGTATPVIVHMKPPTVSQAPNIPRPPAN